MRIVRIWLYKISEVPKPGLVWPPKGHTEPNKEVYGEFKYYALQGEAAQRSCRKEARRWEQLTGQAVETIVGYPAFMQDQGYRV